MAFELVYPSDTVPVIGPAKGSETMIPVVETTGEVVGRASRKYVHGRPQLLHPSVHLHVIDRNSRLYLQLRGRNQESHPGKWDMAVGGHVGFGELFEEAVYREAREELGMYDFNPIFIDSYLYENDGQRELVNVYAAVGGFDLHPNTYEVQEGRYWTAEEIGDKLGKNIFTPAFEREFKDYYSKLEALL